MRYNPNLHPAIARLLERLSPWWKWQRHGPEVWLYCRRCTKVYGISRGEEPSTGTLHLLIDHTLAHQPTAPLCAAHILTEEGCEHLKESTEATKITQPKIFPLANI